MLTIQPWCYRAARARICASDRPQARIVLELHGRNTAPALTLAALAAQDGGTDPMLLLVMPADHAIAQPALLAQEGAIVPFGLTPDRPETGYDYIQTSPPVGRDRAHTIDRSVGKTRPCNGQGLRAIGRLPL
ncbi:hypothetical protein B2J88_20395 [Rhodococcus sp. SRB_17]|nr:hypothetical protein [Rhodococcus sp. SRB_17]